jgi:sugar O-acyltransferase (sialic acid O-acetyltransferase NeuD family)
MTPILIVGAGGFGREILDQAQGDYAHGKDWTIKGFLDGRINILKDFNVNVSICGDPINHQVSPGEQFLLGLSKPEDKKKYTENILKQGGYFINLCTSLHRAKSSVMGIGNVFGLGVQLSADSKLEDFISIQAGTIIGHDVSIKSFCHIGAQCFVAGNVKIGAGSVIHPHSVITAGAQLGENVIVSPGSVVYGKIPSGITVMGNPAKRFGFK